MKKIIFFFLFLVMIFINSLKCETQCFSFALSAGYVFKDDNIFKKVYGNGIVNIITADGCYYPWANWGIGSKISYWSTHGKTTFLKKRTCLEEVPLTFYIRRIQDLSCNFQAYASLGGGIVWVKEKSYLGDFRIHKGIGELEIGLNLSIWQNLSLTGAVRYLFPRQCVNNRKMDIGGVDLRLGLEFPF